MCYKGIIFDLDGTLINSLTDIANCMNKALADFNMPTHEEESYKDFIGTGVLNLTKNALKGDFKGDSELTEMVRSRYSAYYDTHYLDNTKPYEGIVALLLALKKQGFKMGVLSNKPHSFTVLLTETLFGKEFFHMILGQQDGLPKKPDPLTALMIAKELSLNPDEILYVGDSGVDMQTAKRANMTAVGVLWGFRGEEELKENGANRIVHTPEDILKLALL